MNISPIPVILCGGSGTRLWPLSRTKYPKQFVDLGAGRTLFKNTIERAKTVCERTDPIIVCNREHRFYADSSLQEEGISGTIILEEQPRNTAPAIALAAFAAMEKDKDAAICVFPSDHVLADEKLLADMVKKAMPLVNQGYLITFGIAPSSPETGYGYIERAEPLEDGIFGVKRFTEKPSLEKAEKMLSQGGYYWNSGMFLFNASVYLEELKKFEPDMFQATETAWKKRRKDLNFTIPGQEFLSSPANSIDYAVMERTDRAAVLSLETDWNDLGSWESFYEIAPKDEAGNVCEGDVLTKDSHNCYLRSGSRLIAALGMENTAVIETKDAILVMDRSRSQDVKGIVETLKKEKRSEYDSHPKVFRPWGYYETLILGDRFQVKRIVVMPGQENSLQMHYHRAEHWVIVSGTAEITTGTEKRIYVENESVYIPLGTNHRIHNPGVIPLVFIEVQSGSYLGEDDIVRLEDNYGRAFTSEDVPPHQ